MDAGVSVNQLAHLPNLEGESRLLEGRLHLAWTEVVQITAILPGAALAQLCCKFREFAWILLQLLQYLGQLSHGLIPGARDCLASPPDNWVARSSVLEQDVAGADRCNEIQELNLELQGSLGRDDWRIAIVAVCILRRANQHGLGAFPHLKETLVPASDDLADADLSLEGPVFLHGRVEDAAVRQSTVVMRSDESTFRAKIAAALL